jgi:predicted negative regulator of RcsB-dependent stress response
MINTLLVIVFSLSTNAGMDLAAASVDNQPVTEAEAQSLYKLMDQNGQRIFDNVGAKAEENVAVSQTEADELYSQIDENRGRIFANITEKVEQDVIADLEAQMLNQEPVLVSAAH